MFAHLSSRVLIPILVFSVQPYPLVCLMTRTSQKAADKEMPHIDCVREAGPFLSMRDALRVRVREARMPVKCHSAFLSA